MATITRPSILVPADLGVSNFCRPGESNPFDTERQDIGAWAYRFFESLGDETLDFVLDILEQIPDDASPEDQHRFWHNRILR